MQRKLHQWRPQTVANNLTTNKKGAVHVAVVMQNVENNTRAAFGRKAGTTARSPDTALQAKNIANAKEHLETAIWTVENISGITAISSYTGIETSGLDRQKKTFDPFSQSKLNRNSQLPTSALQTL